MEYLYIDMSSGVSVTELINAVISSGCIKLDQLMEDLNSRFGGLAQFSYQHMNQDGISFAHMIVNGKEYPQNESIVINHPSISQDAFGNKIEIDKSFSTFNMNPNPGFDKRMDSVDSLIYEFKLQSIDNEKLSLRWPAKTQLLGAALSSIMRSYWTGKICILDKVKLSNGMTYSVVEAWDHRQYLLPEECAALSVLVTFGQAVNQQSFKTIVESIGAVSHRVDLRGDVKVYLVNDKESLYKP